jgi:hypothetical protein
VSEIHLDDIHACLQCGGPVTSVTTDGENRPCGHRVGTLRHSKADVAARIRRFLNLNDHFTDEEPMWMAGGICLSWGDLRTLADYSGEEEPGLAESISPRMLEIAREERARGWFWCTTCSYGTSDGPKAADHQQETKHLVNVNLRGPRP